MQSAGVRAAYVAALAALISGLPCVSHAVDCSDKFPVGPFALTRENVAPLTAKVSGFSPVYLSKKPLQMKPSGAGDPCEFVYGFDVFEFSDGKQSGALVAGCSGDFDGDGVRDYVVLLRRDTDAVILAFVFFARGGTFDVVKLGAYGDPPAWSGPYCSRRPRNDLFEVPDFEGTGSAEKVRVFGDLITMGWSTFYWRPDLRQFESILTTD
jgi:hypothetical protein